MAMETTVKIVTEADTTGVEDIQTALEQLQSEAVIDLSVNGDTSEIDEANEKTQELSDNSDNAANSTNNLGVAMSGLAGLGVGATLNSAISSADEYNIQIQALNNRFNSFGVSSQQLANSIQSVTDATSISGSQARSYYQTMSNYGVTSTTALSNSMTTLYGQAALGGVAFEDASAAMEKMVASGNLSARMVTRLGASLPVLAQNLGMSEEQFKTAFADATPQQRLEMLTKAMGDTSQGIQMMNDSVGANMAEVRQEFDLALREVGMSLLPLVTAGLNATLPLVQLLAAAMGNPVFATIVGVLAGGLAILLTLGGALKIAGLAVEGLSAGIGVLNTLIALLTGETTLETLAQEGNTLAKAANTVASWAATAATLALAAAEFLLASPILLVTLAIVALIAILWYLYNTNETVRKGINFLINIFKTFVSILIGAVYSAIQKVQNALNLIKGVIDKVKGALSPFASGWSRLSGAVSGVIGPISSAYSWIKKVWDLLQQGGSTLMSALGMGGAAGGANLMTAEEKAYVNSLNGTTSYSIPTQDNLKSAGGTINNLTLNVGTVDSDDRVHEIVEAVRKELAWSNATAGRTV